MFIELYSPNCLLCLLREVVVYTTDDAWVEGKRSWKKHGLAFCLLFWPCFELFILFWCTWIAETLLTAFSKDVVLLVWTLCSIFVDLFVFVCCSNLFAILSAAITGKMSSRLDVNNPNAISPCKMSTITNSNRINSNILLILAFSFPFISDKSAPFLLDVSICFMHTEFC